MDTNVRIFYPEGIPSGLIILIGNGINISIISIVLVYSFHLSNFTKKNTFCQKGKRGAQLPLLLGMEPN